MHTFCPGGFKCSRPSVTIEKVIWAAIKKFADHWCNVTTTNSIQTQYGITLDVPCDRYKYRYGSIKLKYQHHINAHLKQAPMGGLKTAFRKAPVHRTSLEFVQIGAVQNKRYHYLNRPQWQLPFQERSKLKSVTIAIAITAHRHSASSPLTWHFTVRHVRAGASPVVRTATPFVTAAPAASISAPSVTCMICCHRVTFAHSRRT